MSLSLPFDSDDREFVRGVQVGMLWVAAQTEPYPTSILMYEDNAEMIARVIEALPDAQIDVRDNGPGWVEVSWGEP